MAMALNSGAPVEDLAKWGSRVGLMTSSVNVERPPSTSSRPHTAPNLKLTSQCPLWNSHGDRCRTHLLTRPRQMDLHDKLISALREVRPLCLPDVTPTFRFFPVLPD